MSTSVKETTAGSTLTRLDLGGQDFQHSIVADMLVAA